MTEPAKQPETPATPLSAEADLKNRAIQDRQGKAVAAIVTTYQDEALSLPFALVRWGEGRTAKVPLGALRETEPGGPLEWVTDESSFSGESAAAGEQTLRLLEEVPDIQIRREALGSVVVRREVETRTETVEVALMTETLVLTRVGLEGDQKADAVQPTVVVDGQPLEAGGEVRIVIYKEAADVRKIAVVREEVGIHKESVEERQTVELELGREEIRVEKVGDVIVHEEVSTTPRQG